MSKKTSKIKDTEKLIPGVVTLISDKQRRYDFQRNAS